MGPTDCPLPVCGEKLGELERQVGELERQVTQLRINEASRVVAIEHLTEVAVKLTEKVEQLTMILERGKGAAWVVRLAWAAVVAAVAWLASRIKDVA